MYKTHIPTLHRDWLDSSSVKIVQSLQQSGFECYLVGGCVRDLLVGIHPKDFDIATNATPQEVKKIIPGSYIIGKRFRLVLVRRGERQFEVATFRRNMRPDDMEEDELPIVGDNYFGTSEEDAKRRDFTINGLFYDPLKSEIIDFVDGQKDIEAHVIRMIGAPEERLIEDPIRSLRALRLSHKLNFIIEPTLREAIHKTHQEISRSVLPRRREEWIKILKLDHPSRIFAELFDLLILQSVLPTLHGLFQDHHLLTIFDEMIDRIEWAGIDSTPEELLCFLAFSVHSLLKEKNQDTKAVNELLEKFMKDELGMFKAEMSVFYGALETLNALGSIDQYLKRGQRRKQAFLRNPELSLALKFGLLDHSIGEQQYHFWIQQIHEQLQLNR